MLLADDKGIHYFYSTRLGYNRQERVFLWEDIRGIRPLVGRANDCEDEDECCTIEIIGMDDPDSPTVIFLDDTKTSPDTIDDIVAKLNELWEYYSGSANSFQAG